jgi:hypothetical protein
MELVKTAAVSTIDRDSPDYDFHAANRGELLERPARARHRHKARSRITNYCDELPGVSGNDPKARRFRDLVNAFVAALGGLERVGDIKLVIVRQLAALVVNAEETAAQMVKGEKINVGELCTLSSTCLRLSVRLGLERTEPPKPGLHDRGGLLDQLAHERDAAAATNGADTYSDGDVDDTD